MKNCNISAKYTQSPQNWHDDAELAFVVHYCGKFHISKMADSRHLEN